MNIHLTPLAPWSERRSASNTPGVYLVTKAGKLVYVGMTRSGKGLRSRLQRFNGCAMTGEGKHAGGITFFKTFGPLDPAEVEFQVHVSTIVSNDTGVLYPYILYVERRLIWEHIEQHGKLPKCNSM